MNFFFSQDKHLRSSTVSIHSPNCSFGGDIIEISLKTQMHLFLFAESGEVDPEIARLNALGFTGCLSVVQFNSISPLKAALLYPDTSPVIVTGPLSESSCGSSLATNPYAAETTHSLTGNAIKTDDHFLHWFSYIVQQSGSWSKIPFPFFTGELIYTNNS